MSRVRYDWSIFSWLRNASHPHRSDAEPFSLRRITVSSNFEKSRHVKNQPTHIRCSWAEGDPIMQEYHDTEWGVPEYDSRALWEKLMLDGFQAGLSWSIILRKREAFRKAFKNFDPEKVARFGESDIVRLLGDAGIVRARAKIEATIGGARAFLSMRDSGEDFSQFVWEMAGGKPIQNGGKMLTQSPLSEKLSKELKLRGFKFVGPVIVYAWMQAVGILNDHSETCFRRKALGKAKKNSKQA